jgi:hypothetical protein
MPQMTVSRAVHQIHARISFLLGINPAVRLLYMRAQRLKKACFGCDWQDLCIRQHFASEINSFAAEP